MPYLLTDHENKTWEGLIWAPNCTYKETNENFLFEAYKSPTTPAYLYLSYEGNIKPKMWKCSGIEYTKIINNEIVNSEIRGFYTELTTIEEIPLKLPTNEQLINFAILCALFATQNQTYKNWTINYLKGKNEDILEKIIEEKISDSIMPVYQKIGPCFPAIASTIENPPYYAACTAHKSYYTSFIDLEKIIQIVENLNSKEIAEFI